MTKKILKSRLEQNSARISRRISKLKGVSKQLSRIRIAYFIVSIIVLYLLSSVLSDVIFLISLVLLITGFIVLVDRHQKIEATIQRFEELLRIKKEHLARMDLRWDEIPRKELKLEVENHPFASDLDLMGEHSVFQLIDSSIYTESALRLKNWLLQIKPAANDIHLRQAKVKELVPLQMFRDKLRVLGAITHSESRNAWNNQEMLAWLRNPPKQGLQKAVIISAILAACNILFLSLMLARIASPFFLMTSLVCYLLYYKFNDRLYSDLFDAAFNIEKILNRFKGILKHLESFRAGDTTHLSNILEVYQSEQERPSKVIKSAQRLMSRAALQANQILWLIVNVCVPWDMYYAWRIEKMRQSIEPKLTKWLDSFYELEALNSLANFAMLNPEFSWPEINDASNNAFSAQDLGHPLIPDEARISNDFKVHPNKDLFLITGSNMAGKSTFLRTVGVNLVLAFTGAPVCAKSLNTQVFRYFRALILQIHWMKDIPIFTQKYADYAIYWMNWPT